jgi:histone deacetylase 1/2
MILILQDVFLYLKFFICLIDLDNIGNDCPVFDGLFHYCQISAGGSVCLLLCVIVVIFVKNSECNTSESTKVRHSNKLGWWFASREKIRSFRILLCERYRPCHYRASEVLILSILFYFFCIKICRFHPRVMYIDIDVHHGDAVEEAFYTTDRFVHIGY